MAVPVVGVVYRKLCDMVLYCVHGMVADDTAAATAANAAATAATATATTATAAAATAAANHAKTTTGGNTITEGDSRGRHSNMSTCVSRNEVHLTDLKTSVHT